MTDATISADRCMNCSKTLGAISQHLARLPEEAKEATKLALAVEIVRGLLIEFARELEEGSEPYDALLSAVQGKRPL